MIGQTLLHYHFLKKLGQSGMGQIYLAESVREHPERLRRFRTEAKSVAKLNHPNIARIHALEEAMPEDDGSDDDILHDVGAYCNTPLHFIVMEYVPGTAYG